MYLASFQNPPMMEGPPESIYQQTADGCHGWGHRMAARVPPTVLNRKQAPVPHKRLLSRKHLVVVNVRERKLHDNWHS